MSYEKTFADDIKKAVEILKKGGIILYPTETIWGIGCDATNAKAIRRIYKLKKRSGSKSMIILVEDELRLKHHVKKVPEIVSDLIQSIRKPLSVIYPEARNLANNAIAEDGSVAIRITSHPFCQALIKNLNKPIVSTSANFSGEPAPNTFQSIAPIIKESVDLIVPMLYESINEVKASTLIQVKNDGTFIILRD
ncbi:MAG: L-threonylcarbamoyladenylate synthase [Bacteroidales bacterium]|nr:L-threonylcarbamoyladenylate synthase [Bacteroidales bacterium]MDD2323712.1 L-threonylcarbamoyladenylate synthase [Bacteroidales bacterium]MDD3010552.1 L-threonylcarbamoyladenylate synthase [Bacteroidales bacterium]MDD3962381.1 L-threonylcarbamoyladenylate synthase [Bacteroidales bacterium]MDY0285635.1 L-threonylcarbamoyladenylate synthase [Bacteroidales bacterium]